MVTSVKKLFIGFTRTVSSEKKSAQDDKYSKTIAFNSQKRDPGETMLILYLRTST